MPSRPPTISRRRLLAGAAALAALGASAETLTACGAAPAPPPDLDDLTTALDRARSDSKLATDAVAAARGSIADTLTEVASVRSAHGEALADEIVRLTGAAAPTTTVITTTTTSSPPAPAPTADDVIGALRTSADSATQAAAALSGYRAGLLASIAAACAVAYSVALTPVGGGQ